MQTSSTPALLSTPATKAGLTESTTSPAKRRYIADTQDVEVVKKIKQNEVELQDRNTVLRGMKPNVSGLFL
jgi:parafibromin